MSKVAQLKADLDKIQTGYGLMSLTWKAEPTPREIAFESMHKVIEFAQTQKCKAFFNVGEFYGPNFINLIYVKEFFEKYPELRSNVIVSCKGAIDDVRLVPKGSYDDVITSVRNSVEAIGGVIDIFEVARLDKSICAEGEIYPYESFKALSELVEEGVIDGISLSEVTAEEIQAIAKDWGKYLTCVEVELSLFSTDILHNNVAKVNNDLGLVTICYSPLGRGLLTGNIKSLKDIPEGDFRLNLKRFQGDALKQNFALIDFLQNEIIDKREPSSQVSLAQIALGWIKHWSFSPEYPKGKFIPIPSGSTVNRVIENFDESKAKMTDAEFTKINEFLKTFVTTGGRYETEN
ncbi:similar to Saccharomyces cerevisiae YPR127W Protein of unknown function, differentially expressed during alcoholic fermentation [Maudiozyma saulgeensis]|uniref:NADP-dependent oxidoreductase domain-containing protein n=1 Tax=Maudiozyma saulgeensis TaxID=1789683 RepID=A0A1X7R8W7_9SACH|nr:similar to Saccharomyces cerevisiae YPR127W Protein of unknown function, differentially expressed during alcoholic fermentation [Kazachstania saulgeensis]